MVDSGSRVRKLNIPKTIHQIFCYTSNREFAPTICKYIDTQFMLAIFVFQNTYRAHIIRGAYNGSGEINVLKNFSKSEVTKLDVKIFV